MKNVILGLVAVACSLAGLMAQNQTQNLRAPGEAERSIIRPE